MLNRTLNWLLWLEAAAVLIIVGVWIFSRTTSPAEAQGGDSPVSGQNAKRPSVDSKPVAPVIQPVTIEPVHPSGPGNKPSSISSAAATQTPAKPAVKPAVRPARVSEDPCRVDPKSKPLPTLVAPSIVVQKSRLRLWVFDQGKPVKTYRIAVGENVGDKLQEGDRKTPEGDFYVCIRKTKPATPYTRSLGLSYPNVEDAERGLRDGLLTREQSNTIVDAIRNHRQPPWNTPLGGAIMIHGKREGRVGTLGCIALDDDDVIELYNQIPMGTPVRVLR